MNRSTAHVLNSVTGKKEDEKDRSLALATSKS